jgi:hypothetical protein
MPCYKPYEAFRLRSGEIVFNESKYKRFIDKKIQLPCRQCIGCRLAYSAEWANRITAESKLYPQNAFITLTYAPEHLPENANLEKAHYQKFMKDLRYYAQGSVPVPLLDDGTKENSIRYFMCGEYGDQGNRPHYHACLLNYQFPDLRLKSQNKLGQKTYTSKLLEKIWGKGFVTTAELTAESAAYVARYVVKKYKGKSADKHYSCVDPETGECFQKVPEYATMSRRVAIGIPALDKWKTDYYPVDKMRSRKRSGDYLVTKPPRIFDTYMKKENEHLMAQVKLKREEKITELYLRDPHEFSAERLATKEFVHQERIKQLKRDSF